MREDSMIGKSIERVDALEKVTGRALFAFDVDLPGMLYGKILRSTSPHAKILKIDTSKAKKIEGVVAVLTGKDVSDMRYGMTVFDEPILTEDKVRYVGDALAAVAAETSKIAERAIDLIEVEYEELNPLFDPEEAMKPDPPAIIHEDLPYYFKPPIPASQLDIERPNVYIYHKIRKGDVEKGFKESDLVVENRYSTAMIQHCQLETHNCVAKFDDGEELTVWTSVQDPYIVRQILSGVLLIPEPQIRIIVPYVGGAFGGKIETTCEVICAHLAKTTKRPVKIVNTRNETFTTATVRHPVISYIKDGVKADGTLLAREMKLIYDGGAYSKSGGVTTKMSSLAATSTYRIPNFKLDSYGVYTNKPSGGAFRGFGSAQVCFPIESQMDETAHRLGISPEEIRVKNALDEGEKNIIEEVVISDGTKECIKRCTEALEEKKHKEREVGVWRRGTGISLGNKNSMAPTFSVAHVKVHGDEIIEVFTSAMELGQGGHTAMAQIAAEEFGVSVDKIRLTTGDTRYCPFDQGALSSRQTYNTGNAIKMACQDAKRQIFEHASTLLDAKAEDLETQECKVFVKGRPEKYVRIYQLFEPVMGGMFPIRGQEIFGRGNWKQQADLIDPETGLLMGVNPVGRPVSFYIFACHGVEIEVNVETGQIRVLSYISANDVGKAINPELVKGQALGGIGMGIGSSLMEELILENGTAINANFADYQIPTASEMPYAKDMESIIVEAHHKDGPYGAKGVGEVTMIPTASAIANALFDAVGIRIRDLPLTPEKVLKALKEKRL